MIDITVAIATYNPKPLYIKRVLDGLRNQTFPLDRWELIVVDNNSSVPPLHDAYDNWHPVFKLVNEPKQGLAQVRRRSFEEATGKLIILLDDDLILDADYLRNAWEIFNNFPFLGIYGTQLIPEFEVAPTMKIEHYLNAERKVGATSWSNNINDHTSTPWGAGMCVRMELARQYLQILYKEPFRLELGRKGNKRLSCEDMDISIFTCLSGMGKGMFSQLKATHLVPKEKMQEAHLVSTVYWNTYSYSIQNYMLFKTWPQKPQSLLSKVAGFMRNSRKEKIERKFEMAKRRAMADAARDIKAGTFNF